MGYSKVKIFNIALNNLGVSATIQNAAQSDPKTITLNNYYDLAVEQVLKDFDWNFASTYRELTPTGNNCLNPKYQFEYDYPNDCLSAREIVSGNSINFEISSNASGQRVINTNVSPATLRYTRLVDKETYFTPEFVMAISWYLSFLIAETLTGSTSKRDKALATYSGMVQKAVVTNAYEGFEDDESEASWIEAR